MIARMICDSDAFLHPLQMGSFRVPVLGVYEELHNSSSSPFLEGIIGTMEKKIGTTGIIGLYRGYIGGVVAVQVVWAHPRLHCEWRKSCMTYL